MGGGLMEATERLSAMYKGGGLVPRGMNRRAYGKNS
jgi:hypothetical protein